ncbi:cytochrome bd oxidase small subunit CydS [Halalkalibacillus sediminis]
MNEFLITWAPFIVVIASMTGAFWVGLKDDAVKDHHIE